MERTKEKNLAFIDGQNLHLGTKESGWKVDLNKFKVYLKDKFSGDGDYKKIIDYLISKGKFGKILFPNQKFASSLYKSLKAKSFDYLINIRSYIQRYKKEKGS
jgi:hypothetical protein